MSPFNPIQSLPVKESEVSGSLFKPRLDLRRNNVLHDSPYVK